MNFVFNYKYVRFFMLFVGVYTNAFARVYKVDPTGPIQEIVSGLKAGDTLLFKAGIYKDLKLKIALEGRSDEPITIRSELEYAAIITGASDWFIKSEHLNIEGFSFVENSSNIIRLESSSYCRLSRLQFLRNESSCLVRIVKGGVYNRIDHCDFKYNAAVHIFLSPGRDNPVYPKFTRIDSNTFSDVPFREKGNGRETIKLGSRPYSYGDMKAYALVEENRFIRCNGEPEIISNKCSNNIFRNNEFIHCIGELVLRGGNNCIVSGNNFENGSGGIRLSGKKHLIYNNVIWASQSTELYNRDVPNTGTGIRLVNGSGNENPTFYLAVSDCLIAHNTILNCEDVAIELGSFKGRDLVKTSIQQNKTWLVERYGEGKFLTIAPSNNYVYNNLIVSDEKKSIRRIDSASNHFAANILFSNEDLKGLALGPHVRKLKNTDVFASKIKDLPIVDLSSFIGFHPKQLGAYSVTSYEYADFISKWMDLNPEEEKWLLN